MEPSPADFALEQEQITASRTDKGVGSSDSSASQDSRLAYIVCHLISAANNLAVFAGIVWLAYTLKSGWVLWALLLCPWSRYKHDFNGVNRSSPNKECSQPATQ